jgi:alkylmercury lyase-like protein
MDSLTQDVRLYIYAQMIESSAAPAAAETARALSCSVPEAEEAYRALAEAHVIVLRPGSTTIWMAPPFSNMQSAFTVISGGRAYYAPCAWDAFGIPAALGADARIFTTCADCGGVLERKVAAGNISETRGLVHFPVPGRRWWDDIGFT